MPMDEDGAGDFSHSIIIIITVVRAEVAAAAAAAAVDAALKICWNLIIQPRVHPAPVPCYQC